MAASRTAAWRPHAKRLGTAIAAVREQKGWSAAELSRRTKIGPDQISRIEDGKKPRVSFAEIAVLCRLLKLAPVLLWFGDEAAVDAPPEPNGAAPASAR